MLIKNPYYWAICYNMLLGISLNLVQCVIQEDDKKNFTEIALEYGFKAEEHDVHTEDGYILKLHHITGNRRKPVLLMHGVLDSSVTFLLRGSTSMAAELSQSGYDVWLANNRGNLFSRGHSQLNAGEDNLFWNFSVHEMAIYDLPACIDYILSYNDVKRLSLIGHSQGNTQFYILGAMRPKYNKVVNVAIALGPVAYLNIDNYQFTLPIFIKTVTLLNKWFVATGQEEVLRDKSLLKWFKDNVCASKLFGYEICCKGIFALIGGEDIEELEPEMYYQVIKYYLCSTSRKNIEHLLQGALRKQFSQFDYGQQMNLQVYQSRTPPLYDLSKVTMKVALFEGANDNITPMKNVVNLRNKLPNVVDFHVMERKKFNHLDYVWGRHMHRYLYPHVLRILDEYTL